MSPDSPSSQDPIPLCVWSVPSLVVVRRLGAIVVEEDNELITFQEESTLTNMYFRANIPQAKQAEVNYKLTEFFFKQYNVKSDDMNLFNLLLGAPRDELDRIMATHNRFLPDRENINDQGAFGFRNPDRMDVIVIEDDASEQRDDELSIITREQANTLGQPARIPAPNPFTPLVPSIQVQYSLRELIPSFQLRAQSIARSAGNFRISRRPITRGSAHARSRNERLRQIPQPVHRPPVPIPPLPTAPQLPQSFVEISNSYDPPAELTLDSTDQQIRTREIGFLGEAFVFHLFLTRALRFF